MSAKSTSPATDARAIADAAVAFLAALTPGQRAKVAFPFDSPERTNWHYVPRARKGLARRDMNEAQLEAADALLAATASGRAFHQIKAVFQREVTLKAIEQAKGTLIHERDPGLYYFSVFGDPSGAAPWGWRVDGHHVSVNIAVMDNEVVALTPFFIGSNPAEVPHGPDKGHRILVDEEDLARRLLLSLGPQDRARATIYPAVPRDIFTRASRRVEIAAASGLPAFAMSGGQRETLATLIRVYTSRAAGALESSWLRRLDRDGLDGVHFGWAGSEHPRQPHYYRLHGPSFFAEYDNTQDNANHIHSVWRDIDSDFGFDALAAHYRQSH